MFTTTVSPNGQLLTVVFTKDHDKFEQPKMAEWLRVAHRAVDANLRQVRACEHSADDTFITRTFSINKH